MAAASILHRACCLSPHSTSFSAAPPSYRDRRYSSADDDWRIAAHRLKGASAQIGARGLAEICLAAEKEYKGGLESKQAMLHDIESVFEEVQAFFQARLGGPRQISSI